MQSILMVAVMVVGQAQAKETPIPEFEGSPRFYYGPALTLPDGVKIEVEKHGRDTVTLTKPSDDELTLPGKVIVGRGRIEVVFPLDEQEDGAKPSAGPRSRPALVGAGPPPFPHVPSLRSPVWKIEINKYKNEKTPDRPNTVTFTKGNKEHSFTGTINKKEISGGYVWHW